MGEEKAAVCMLDLESSVDLFSRPYYWFRASRKENGGVSKQVRPCGQMSASRFDRNSGEVLENSLALLASEGKDLWHSMPWDSTFFSAATGGGQLETLAGCAKGRRAVRC